LESQNANTRMPHPLRNTAWHELALDLDEIRTESRPSFVLAPNFLPQLTLLKHPSIHSWANSFPTQTQVHRWYSSSVCRLSIRL
jgi:hypothetical protein